MADFKKLTVDGNTYNVKDEQARTSASSALSVATAAQIAANSKLPIAGTTTGSVVSKATTLWATGSTGANSVSELRAGNGLNDSFIEVRDNGNARVYGHSNVKIESEVNDINIDAHADLHLSAVDDFDIETTGVKLYSAQNDLFVEPGKDINLDPVNNVYVHNEIVATQPWVLNHIPGSVDPSPLPLNAPYNFRTVPDINALKKKVTLVGGTICWNQLVQATDTSCTVTNGHKYISFLSGTWAVGSSTGSAFTVDGANGDKVFDTTLMFGSAIADYVHGLGNTDGVAWFQSLFPLATYAYNAGTLYSVNPEEAITENFDQSETNTYELNHLTLYGLYKLDGNNRLYADGDTYEHDGTVTRKWTTVTLNGGTLQVANVYQSGGIYYALINLPTTGVNSAVNIITIISAGYVNYATVGIGNIYVTNGGNSVVLCMNDQTLTTKALADAYFANNPLDMVYLLATPTTETAATFDEEMIVYPNGTEALTDYAYTQGQRDVQIPVGNVTLYERKVTAVPAAPITPGQYWLSAYVDNDGNTYYVWEA